VSAILAWWKANPLPERPKRSKPRGQKQQGAGHGNDGDFSGANRQRVEVRLGLNILALPSVHDREEPRVARMRGTLGTRPVPGAHQIIKRSILKKSPGCLSLAILVQVPLPGTKLEPAL
jgi:hypothetical protein